MENKLESNLIGLGEAARRMHIVAKATAEEVERQDKVLDRVAIKVRLFLFIGLVPTVLTYFQTDQLGEGVVTNRAILSRIH